MLFITKNTTIKLVEKNTTESWRESGRNHAVRLIRQVQQLSHAREQKLSLEDSYAFFVERETKQKICAAGQFHSGGSTNNQHVQKLTESWSKMALAIGDLDVHAKLCVGDVPSNEIFYHKNPLSQFHNRYRAPHDKKDDGTDQRKKVLLQTYAWRQILNNVYVN